MQHVDPETLALLALGEQVASPEERDHLESCDACRDEVADLTQTARVGRTTLADGALLAPPARVWESIAEELDLTRPRPIATLPRRRALLAVLAAAAAVAVVAAGLGVWTLIRPVQSVVLASAELDAFPDWPGAHGTAELEERPSGERVVSVTLDAPASTSGYREVWLIASDESGLVSLGTVRGEGGTLPVPDGLDLDNYRIVDISAEPFDGNPQHSGDSIVRGELRAATALGPIPVAE